MMDAAEESEESEKAEKSKKKKTKSKKAKDEEEVPAPKEVPKDEIAKIEEARSEAGDAEDKTDKKEKKKDKKKDAKRKREAEDTEAAADGDVFAIDTGSAKKGKKPKSKTAKDSTEDNAAKGRPGQTEADGEQWNVSALEGGSARQAKFLKLLGGGKKAGAGAAASTHNGHGSSKQDIEKVQTSLEKQFYSGMKMKHDGQGHKRGLGA